jgi:hypothetical protein
MEDAKEKMNYKSTFEVLTKQSLGRSKSIERMDSAMRNTKSNTETSY